MKLDKPERLVFRLRAETERKKTKKKEKKGEDEPSGTGREPDRRREIHGSGFLKMEGRELRERKVREVYLFSFVKDVISSMK